MLTDTEITFQLSAASFLLNKFRLFITKGDFKNGTRRQYASCYGNYYASW